MLVWSVLPYLKLCLSLSYLFWAVIPKLVMLSCQPDKKPDTS